MLLIGVDVVDSSWRLSTKIKTANREAVVDGGDGYCAGG